MEPKLRKLAFAIKNSTTIILPEWFSILEQLAQAAEEAGKIPLSERMMPRDVATRWNATFDMLKFAIEYRDAIDKITGDLKMKLRQFELSDEEWTFAEQLAKLLKVSKLSLIVDRNTNQIFSDFQRRNALFFARNTKPCNGDSSHGPPRLFSRHCCSRRRVSPIDSSLGDNRKDVAQQVL